MPYVKEISADFTIKVTESNVSYSVEDEANRIYAILKLVNTKDTANNITLTFDPNLVVIDTSDDAYKNRTSQGSQTIDGVSYINSITFSLAAEQSKNIKFYKRNQTANYTYPNGTYGSMIINVTESN